MRTAQRHLVDPEPDHDPSQRTDYSARATDRTASTTSPQHTPRLDGTEYSTQNTDYNHIPRRDTNFLDSPSDRSRGRAPGAHTPSPTHTMYKAQQKEPRPTHATTQWHTDDCPKDGRHNGAPRGEGNRRAKSTATTGGPRTGPHPITTHRLQRPSHKPNHKHHTAPAYPDPGPHGV